MFLFTIFSHILSNDGLTLWLSDWEKDKQVYREALSLKEMYTLTLKKYKRLEFIMFLFTIFSNILSNDSLTVWLSDWENDKQVYREEMFTLTLKKYKRLELIMFLFTILSHILSNVSRLMYTIQTPAFLRIFHYWTVFYMIQKNTNVLWSDNYKY